MGSRQYVIFKIKGICVLLPPFRFKRFCTYRELNLFCKLLLLVLLLLLLLVVVVVFHLFMFIYLFCIQHFVLD